MIVDKSKLMVRVRETLEKEGVTKGGSIYRNVVDAVLKELGYDGQAQARIETLSAENSAQHQEIIALRRQVAALERTIGSLRAELEPAPRVTPWFEFPTEDLMKQVVELALHPVQNPVSPTSVDGVGVGSK